MKILVIHGPNLNLLGEREPGVYGHLSLADVNRELKRLADELGMEVESFQSNHEGQIIDKLHEKRKGIHGIVINPGAFTHYSYAIRDAIAAVGLPAMEVHLSDIYSREPFRANSVIREVCIGQISGKGLESYMEGFRNLVKHLVPG